MIGHHNKSIYINAWITLWQFIPYRFNHLSRIIHNHHTIFNLSKQTFPVLGADRDKIRTCL